MAMFYDIEQPEDQAENEEGNFVETGKMVYLELILSIKIVR